MSRLQYFPESVKQILAENYKILTGSFSPEMMSDWKFFAVLKIAVDCPILKALQDAGEVTFPKTAIEKMRQRAIAKIKEVEEPQKPGNEPEDEGESENTGEGKKPSQKRFSSGTEEKPRESEDIKEEVDMKLLSGSFAKKFCGAKVAESVHEYTDAKTGYTSTYKGEIWRGRAYNTRQTHKIWDAWESYLPDIAQSAMITVTPYNEDRTGDYAAQMRELAAECNRMSRNFRREEGFIVFRAIEMTRGTGIHAHMIVATCERREDFLDAVGKICDRSKFSGKIHVEAWGTERGVGYITKTNMQSSEEIAERFSEMSTEEKERALEAVSAWYWSKEANVTLFTHPRNAEQVAEKVASQTKDKVLTAPARNAVPTNDTPEGKEVKREKIRESFAESECRTCKKECAVAKWLQKYVFGDKSLRYKELHQFIADGF